MSTVPEVPQVPAPKSWSRTLRGAGQLLAATAVLAVLCVLPSGLHHVFKLAEALGALFSF